MTEVIEKCEGCPYYKKYSWDGKPKRCKAPEIIEKHGVHGKAIELDDWEDIADFCPLPPRKK